MLLYYIEFSLLNFILDELSNENDRKLNSFGGLKPLMSCSNSVHGLNYCLVMKLIKFGGTPRSPKQSTPMVLL